MLSQTSTSAVDLFRQIFRQELVRELLYLSDVAAGRAQKRADFTDKLFNILKQTIQAIPLPGLPGTVNLLANLPSLMETSLQNTAKKAEFAGNTYLCNQIQSLIKPNKARILTRLTDEMDKVQLEILADRVARLAAYRYEYAFQHLLRDNIVDGVAPLAKVGVARALEFVSRELLPLTEFSLVHGLTGGQSGGGIDGYTNHTLKGKGKNLTAEGVYRRSGWQDELSGNFYVLPEKESKTRIYTDLDENQAKYGYARMPGEMIASYLFRKNSIQPAPEQITALSQLQTYAVTKKDIKDYLQGKISGQSFVQYLRVKYPERIYLKTAIFQGDLSWEDLQNTDFTDCDFSGSNFEGCHFNNTNFTRAQLHGCNFTNATFDKVDFSNANLSYANLSGANLSKAHVQQTDFRFACLKGATLPSRHEGALWYQAELDNTDDPVLREIRDLQQQQLAQATHLSQLEKEIVKQRDALSELLQKVEEANAPEQTKSFLAEESIRLSLQNWCQRELAKQQKHTDEQLAFLHQQMASLIQTQQAQKAEWEALIQTVLPIAVKKEAEQYTALWSKNVEQLQRQVAEVQGKATKLSEKVYGIELEIKGYHQRLHDLERQQKNIPEANSRYKIFISHRGPRKREIAFPLKALFGVFCHEGFAFYDQTSIDIGESNNTVLENAIQKSDTCLAVIDPGFFTSKWCVWEVEQFFNRPESNTKIPILPLFTGLSPEACRDLSDADCADKSGRPLTAEELVQRKAVGKQLGKCSGYSQGENKPIKIFVVDVMLDFLRAGLPADKAAPRISILAEAFRADETLLEKIEIVYEDAVRYFDTSYQKLNAGLFKEFVIETRRKLLAMQSGHMYYPSLAKSHLMRHYTAKAVFRQNDKATPVDEKTFTHLALIKERNKEEKKQEAEEMKRTMASEKDEAKKDKSDEAKPAKDALYWQVSQLDQILKIKEDINIEAIFNGRLQQKMPDKANQNILLLGAPGCGKTMFMYRVMGAFAKLPAEAKNDPLVEILHQRYDWVFCLPLRSLSPEDCESNYAEILHRKGLLPENKHLGNTDKRLDALNALLNVTQARQENPRVLLLLDGFDELPEKLKDKVLQCFIQDSPFQVILTSRPWGLSEEVKAKFGYYLETLGFSEMQVKQYIERYPFKENPENAKVQLQQLFAKPLRMRALMHIPICLELICQLAEDAKNLQSVDAIQTATQLYQRIVRHLLEHNAQRPLGQKEHLDLEIIHEFFTRLAFHTMVQDEKEQFLDRPAILFEKKRAETLLQNSFGLPVNEVEAKASAIWRETMHENNPLLRFSGDDCYFMHLTVQEYLAACGMLRSLEHPSTCEATAEFIIKQRTNPQYRRLLLYVAGLAKDNPQLLNRFFALLLQPPHSVGRVYETCLMIDALEECDVSEKLVLRAKLLDYVEEMFFYLLKHQDTTYQQNAFEQITEALRDAPKTLEGAQKIMPRLLATAKGEGFLPGDSQGRAIIALGHLVKSADTMLAILLEKTRDKNWGVRRAACQVLGTLTPRIPEAQLPEALKCLLEKTKDNSWCGAVSQAAIQALGVLAPRISEASIVEVLKCLLDKTKDWQVEAAAIQALGVLTPHIPEAYIPETVKCLLKKTGDRDSNVRQAAIQALNVLIPRISEANISEARFPEAFKCLLEIAESGIWQICQSGEQMLCALISHIPETYISETLECLLEKNEARSYNIYEEARNSNARQVANRALGVLIPHIPEARFPEAFKCLLKIARSGIWQLRQSGDQTLCVLISRIPETHISETLEWLLEKNEDSNSDARQAAVQALSVLAPRVPETRILEALKSLFKKIEHWNSDVRQTVIRTLSVLAPHIPETHTLEVLKCLLKKTKDKGSDVRQAAIEALGKLTQCIPEARVLEALKCLFEKIGHCDLDVRQGVCQVLCVLTPRIHEVHIPEALRCFLEKTKDNGWGVSQAAVQALGVLAPRIPEANIPEVLKCLLEKTKGNDWGVSQAVQALGELTPRISKIHIFEALKCLLEKTAGEGWQIRQDACHALCMLTQRIPEAYIFEILKCLLEKTEYKISDVRKAVGQALGILISRIPEAHIPETIKYLLKKTGDENRNVRQTAIEALGILVPCVSQKHILKVFKCLLEKTGDTDLDVPYAARKVLDELMKRIPETYILEVLKRLIEKTGDGNSNIRKAAIQLLDKFTPNIPKAYILEVLKCLLEKTGDKDSDVRQCACRALGVLTPRIPETQLPEILKHLLKKTKDNGWGVSQAAIQALSVLALRIHETYIPETLKCLFEKIEHWDSGICKAVIQALGVFAPRIPEIYILETLNRFLEKIKDKDQDSDVRQAIFQVLGELIKRIPEAYIFEVFKCLFEKIGHYWSSKITHSIIQAFGVLAPRIPEARILEALIYLLEKIGRYIDSDVRQAVIQALGVLAPRIPEARIPEAFKYLLEKTGNKNSAVRQAAILALSVLAPRIPEAHIPATLKCLLEKTEDKDWHVSTIRMLGVLALRTPEAQLPEALKCLLEKTKDHGQGVSQAAVQALSLLAPRISEARILEVLKCLIKKTGDKDSDVRQAVTQALCVLAHRISETYIFEALKCLLEKTRDCYSDVRQAVTQVLCILTSRIHEAHIPETLKWLLEKIGDWSVRKDADQALDVLIPRLAETHILEALKCLLEKTGDKNSDVRQGVYHVLNALTSRLSETHILEVLKCLLEKTAGEDWRIRQDACHALGVLTPHIPEAYILETVKCLFEKTKDKASDVRPAAIQALNVLILRASTTRIERTVEQVLYGQLPIFPALSGKVVFYAGGGRRHLFLPSPRAVENEVSPAEMRNQKSADLMLALQAYIDKKKQKPTFVNSDRMRIQAAEHIVGEIKKGRALVEIVQSDGLKDKIGNGSLYDILKIHEPGSVVQSHCALM